MSRRWQGFWLTLASVACVCASPVAAVGAIMSPMVFDRAGSLVNPFAWLAFLMLLLLWAVCLLAPYAAWVTFTRRQGQLAWTLISVPPLWAGIMGLMLVFLPS